VQRVSLPPSFTLASVFPLPLGAVLLCPVILL
jgi:hypothetical protein